MSIAKPFTFTPNTYAKSSEVNQDFDVLYSQVNTNISNIAQNATDIDNLEANKANINGSSSQRFAVADPVVSGDAINKGYLESGNLTLSGDLTFSGNNTFSGDVTLSGGFEISGSGSKTIDGQWVSKYSELSTASAVGTRNLDFSSYLPNDGYSYEVILEVNGSTNSYNATTVTIDNMVYLVFDSTGQGAMTASSIGIVVVPSTRTISYVIANQSASTMYVRAYKYRRIGTNS